MVSIYSTTAFKKNAFACYYNLLLTTALLFLFCSTYALSIAATPDSSGIFIAETDIVTNGEISTLPLFKTLTLREETSYVEKNFLKVVSEDSLAILEYARKEGFHFSRLFVVKTGKPDFLKVTFRLDERSQVRFKDIIVAGAENLFDNTFLQSIANNFHNEAYTSQNISRLLEELVSETEKLGYPYASAQIENVVIDSFFTAGLTVSLHPGQRALLKEVRITGNSQTDSVVIVRLADIPFDEYYSVQTAEAIARRLKRTGIFLKVETPEPYITESDAAGLLINVTEGSANSIDGILGYASADGGNSGGVAGFVNIRFLNLFGSARRFNFRFLKDQTQSQEIEAGYREPLFFSLPFSLGAEYFQRHQDSTYTRSRFTVLSQFNLGDFLYGGVSGFLHSISPSAVNILGFTVFRTSEVGLRGEISYDSRDNFINPTDGVFYVANLSTSRKSIFGPQRFVDSLKPQLITQRRATELKASVFHSFLKKQTAVLHLNFTQLAGDELEESELFRIGGRENLRGYTENQFVTQQAFWGGAEYRLLLTERSFVGVFFDAGNLASPNFLKRFSIDYPDLLYGYGLNGQIETPLGLLLLTIALGRGDSFQQAKVSVGLRTDF
ncbi:MAG TPA: BamA/TamA family outer membrane protein [Patescibacteria group bacterium]|nr:BamA/TamA family outer membrane protein [Patescibacteria group bacterium]